MAINYKRELEQASKSMNLVHDVNLLMKMIVRMIVQKVKVKHAGILLHQQERNTYILTISRGDTGVKIPAGFARVDKDSPLISFFEKHLDKKLYKDGAVTSEQIKRSLKKRIINAKIKRLLKGVLHQMEIFESVACVPSYFQDGLLGILLLGGKNNGRAFQREELDFFAALASDVAMAIRNAQLISELEEELAKRKRLFIHTTIALAAAIDAKDHYTHGHTERVRSLSRMIAFKLFELDKKEPDFKFMETLEIACLLHDIGKIGIPENILNKEAPLTEDEMKRMKEHAIMGATILKPIKELEDAALGVKYHHEKYDGTGYPEGLKGEAIPLIAAIISVADSFDAMITDRPYRPALSKASAIEEIREANGKQLNPRVADAFLKLYREGKI